MPLDRIFFADGGIGTVVDLDKSSGNVENDKLTFRYQHHDGTDEIRREPWWLFLKLLVKNRQVVVDRPMPAHPQRPAAPPPVIFPEKPKRIRFKSIVEESRTQWGKDAPEDEKRSFTDEQLKLGCLQRMADAAEIQASESVQQTKHLSTIAKQLKTLTGSAKPCLDGFLAMLMDASERWERLNRLRRRAEYNGQSGRAPGFEEWEDENDE